MYSQIFELVCSVQSPYCTVAAPCAKTIVAYHTSISRQGPPFNCMCHCFLATMSKIAIRDPMWWLSEGVRRPDKKNTEPQTEGAQKSPDKWKPDLHSLLWQYMWLPMTMPLAGEVPRWLTLTTNSNRELHSSFAIFFYFVFFLCLLYLIFIL